MRQTKILNNAFPNPDLLAYLQNIQDAYFDFFKTAVKCPVLIIDIADKNFLTEEKVYDEIVAHINKKYEIKVHRVQII